MFDQITFDTVVEYGVYALAAVFVFFALRWLVRIALGSVKTEQAPTQAAEEAAVAELEWPKCVVCGDDAVEAKPVVTARTSGLLPYVLEKMRQYLGVELVDSSLSTLVPLYRRQNIRPERREDLFFCRCCSPVADAKVDRFLVTNVRSHFVKANEEATIATTRFMREELVAEMKAELASKKVLTAPLASVPRLAPRQASIPATGTE